ncbi:sugar transferase [Antrihabitans sp. YC2-6]|uniref:sugar transferase n=1 Tax=Antrihabitans sp. YC2-6 TaxID=2799498 RepID=UPI0018F28503|nr:sugar transferase [Antrihabitans sp. YC2-6]MBJ8348672.1 sugar transferase [Antrihabitans sp. YC2-6]
MSFRDRGGASVDVPKFSETHWHSERERWQAEYGRRLQVADTLIVCASVAVAQVVRFGGVDEGSLSWFGNTEVGYTAVSLAIAAIWIGCLSLFSTRSPRVIGVGPEEYRRITSATLRLFGLIAIVSLLFRVEFARGYLAIALPLGLLGLMLSRRAWRRNVLVRRANGDYMTSVLVVGGRDAARAMTTAFARDKSSGFRVVGVCTPSRRQGDAPTFHVEGLEIPVIDDATSVADAARMTGADTVAVAATERLGAQRLRELLWELEPLGIDLVVNPGVVDVAGQRIEVRPVAEMPLVHVEKPQYDRAKSFSKTLFDFCFAFFAVLAVAPVLIAVAIAVKLTSHGPVFYKSERMGIDGKPFQMIKFRSMFVDADKHLTALMEMNEGAGLLFKMKDDPRVTAVGKVLRRFSIDELPQFFNVLRGEMSVVGPRPPLRREVEAYDGKVRRRLLVKPGVTGLWQVSGRSDLSWDESVRLDLSYVENWSMVQDLLIIKKTLSAVANSDGAY